AAGIPTWSPTVVLICRSTAYVWQSGRDAQFSADCGRMCLNVIFQTTEVERAQSTAVTYVKNRTRHNTFFFMDRD
ncbi:hypothetical protein KCU61_g7271, partial [Aureobasidium melanogenum]